MTSEMTFLRRSSNSPRYFDPATRLATSSVQICLPRRMSGTLPVATSWASPSTMAVLPTPGSPRMRGLFFCLRARTCITRSTSRSRPITGSSLPSAASWVRFLPNCSSMEPSSDCCGPCPMPLKNCWPKPTPVGCGRPSLPLLSLFSTNSLTALRTASAETPMRESAVIARSSLWDTMPKSRCSVAM